MCCLFVLNLVSLLISHYSLFCFVVIVVVFLAQGNQAARASLGNASDAILIAPQQQQGLQPPQQGQGQGRAAAAAAGMTIGSYQETDYDPRVAGTL